jgi:hypothetical protein
VDHAFRNALAVEMLELFDQVEVLQKKRAARAGADRVLVVCDRNPGRGGELLVIAQAVLLDLFAMRNSVSVAML